MNDVIMRLSQLTVRYAVAGGLRRREITALAPTNLEVRRGELLAVVGESGSGKTTLGRAMLRLIPVSGGRISFGETELTELGTGSLSKLRARMQMVFQDPYSSLNPRKTIGKTLYEVLAHVGVAKSDRRARAEKLLEQVGLEAAAYDRRPSAFSGGQRQRVAIARALATNPDLVVADEPVSALDVSVQAQVVNLLLDLKEQHGLTMVFISHDLGVVSAIADRIAVMYFGRVVEIGPANVISYSPGHPYSQMLIENVPYPDVDQARAMVSASSAAGAADLPSLLDPPTGCVFRNRCPRADALCASTEPVLTEIGPERLAACHHPLTVSKGTKRENQ